MVTAPNWAGDAFTLDRLIEAIERVPPRQEGFFSPSVYRSMMALGQRDYLAARDPASPRSFMGIEVVPNGAFPMQVQCSACDGTGEGEESTYCPKCKGQGENRYEGMMRSGEQTVLFTSPLPKKFAPSFPRDIVPAPPLSRGLAK